MKDIEWLGHDTFRILGEKTIYFDPFQINTTIPADIIFITHEHFDHCSIDDLRKIIQPRTIIVTIPECQSKLSGLQFSKLILVEPNKNYKVEDLKVETIPAYNTNKFRSPGILYHPKTDGRVGFIITYENKRIYHAGDTDSTKEMLELKNIDIALIPVSGTYVMTPEEAANAVNTFKPKIAIPMHYASIVGTRQDAQEFQKKSKIPVQILQKTQ